MRNLFRNAFKALVALGAVASLSSCEHKELCFDHRDHAHKYAIRIIADYRYDWEECYGGPDWENNWPDHYTPYDSIRPTKPTGLRVINYNHTYNADGSTNIHNLMADGGEVSLYPGYNDILLYNNDTEYIVFSKSDNGASTRATTRTRTRSTYVGSEYANAGEETMTPPDMLYANYIEGYFSEKLAEPEEIYVTLQPLVFTYVVRYEFAEGLEHVAMARGALSGMARSVLMNSGETSVEAATLLYDCEVQQDDCVKTMVKSFGVPAYPNANYPTRTEPKHALNLEVLLKNGNFITMDFDVTDQVQSQPHGGVIVVKGIVVKRDDGTQGEGAFDVDVTDWGETEDITLPL